MHFWWQRLYCMAEGEGAGDGGAGGATGVADPGTDGATPPVGDGTGTAEPPAPVGETPPATAPLDWRFPLPDDLKNDPYVQQNPQLANFVKSAIDTRKWRGSAVQIPGDEATDEQRNEFYTKLGRPENAAAYGDTEGLEYPEGVEFPDNLVTMAREALFKAGLTKAQYDAVMQLDAARWKMMVNEAQAADAQAGLNLQTELNQTFGASAPHIQAQASQVIEMLGNGMWGDAGQRALQKIKAKGLDHDVDFVTAFANIGERMREGTTFPGNDAMLNVGETPETIAQKATEMTQKRTAFQVNGVGTWTDADEREWNRLYTLQQQYQGAMQGQR